MKTRMFFFASLVLAFTSCSSDNENQAQNAETIAFTHYSETRSYTYLGSDYQNRNDFQVSNNKIGSFVSESFIDGISQGQTSGQHFTYNGNGQVIGRVLAQESRVFYYDGQQRISGIKVSFENGFLGYVRFVYLPGGIIYNDRLDAPYDDPAAQVQSRAIIKLDSDGRVIWAGPDFDKDGNVDELNTYTYTGNDLSQVMFSNGNVYPFVYSEAKNTLRFLEINSYGRRTFNAINAPLFANPNIDVLKGNLDSEHVLAENVDSATMELFGNDFVKKISRIEVQGDGTGNPVEITTVTQFFVD